MLQIQLSLENPPWLLQLLTKNVIVIGKSCKAIIADTFVINIPGLSSKQFTVNKYDFTKLTGIH